MSDRGFDTLERLRKLTTSEISDALDRLGIEGQALGFAGTYGTARVVGPAFTVSYLPKGETDGTVGDFIDDVEPGHVVVIDNRGRLDCTVWGNIMCEVGKRRGLGGVVIDGICRDVDLAREIGFPVYARDAAMRTGKDRVSLQAINVSVAIGTTRVDPGDIVVADAGGVIFIPAARLEEVARIAGEIATREEEVLEEVGKGASLRAAREGIGYHSLQSRRNDA